LIEDLVELSGTLNKILKFYKNFFLLIRTKKLSARKMKNVPNIVETLTHDRGVFEDKKTTSQRMLYLLTSHLSTTAITAGGN